MQLLLPVNTAKLCQRGCQLGTLTAYKTTKQAVSEVAGVPSVLCPWHSTGQDPAMR